LKFGERCRANGGDDPARRQSANCPHREIDSISRYTELFTALKALPQCN
jgi:hypothetical protein